MKRAITFVIVFILVNLSFVALHYYADLRSPELVKEHINQGMKTASLSDHNYTVFDFGYPSLYSTIGLDHFTDCYVDLMAMYRSEDPLRNAVVPGIAKLEGSDLCKMRADLASGKISASDLTVGTKARLWHGAKVFLLLALPRINYFQINQLIKISTYFLYGFIGIVIALLAKNIVWPYLSIMMTGFLGAGIVVHGGISNALPYLWSMTGISILLILAVIQKKNLVPLFSMMMGSILAFLYVTDGSLMFALPMIAFISYFVIYEEMPDTQKVSMTFKIIALFMVGFVGSLMFKQLISLMYQDNAWQVFVDTIAYRIAGDYKGQSLTPIHSIQSQLKWYHLATLGWKDLAQFLKFASLISWLVAVVLAVFHWKKFRSNSALIDLTIFLFAPLVVFSRYAIMVNHSSIHVIIVSRYLSIAICFGFAAMIYFVIKIRHDTKNL